jgi:hypothetical protein
MSDTVLERPSRRGQRRTDTDIARGLALFDGLGVVKRKRQVTMYLSDEVFDMLDACANARGLHVATAGAYLIEKQLRDAMEQS